MTFRLLPWCLAWLALAAPVAARAQDGAFLYQSHCALCHGAGNTTGAEALADRAPSREILGKLAPEQIVTALERGAMRAQGADRSRAERNALAEFLSGRPYNGNANPMPATAFCQKPAESFAEAAKGPSWNGWGVTTDNTRFQPTAGLSVGDVPKLRLKWAFGFPGATSASAQPAVFAGRVFVGSWEGDVYALDAKTGCIHWTLPTEAGIRSAISIGQDAGGFTAYFGDLAANVYAVDAATGQLKWKVKIDDYPLARITGSLVMHQGRLYIPVAAREESQVANPKYVCCKFRGNVVALDAASGKRLWKTILIDQEPLPTQKNPTGTQMWGPSGAAVWSAPTIDAQRNVLYVGTGNSYSFPPVGTTDSIIALDLTSGKIRWVRQMTDLDIWNGGCSAGGPQVCSKDAPDFDFGASPILVKAPDGKQMLLAGNKSAVLYAMDPDQDGKLIWQQKLGRGGTSGGILWGPAVADQTVYAALTDQVPTGRGREVDPNVGGGLIAVSVATGDKRWSTPNPPCGDRKPCSPTQAAAVTAIPGVVFSGSNDGRLRAYASGDGKILWEYDTVRDFTTVNGIAAKGGSINNGGTAVAGGMVFTNAGYSHHSGVIPGNVLLAFAVE